MFTVYVLKDGGKTYRGMTTDLEKRLKGHRSGNTRTTRSMKNFRVIYTKTFSGSEEARKYEKYLKSASGRRFLKTLL